MRSGQIYGEKFGGWNWTGEWMGGDGNFNALKVSPRARGVGNSQQVVDSFSDVPSAHGCYSTAGARSGARLTVSRARRRLNGREEAGNE